MVRKIKIDFAIEHTPFDFGRPQGVGGEIVKYLFQHKQFEI